MGFLLAVISALVISALAADPCKDGLTDAASQKSAGGKCYVFFTAAQLPYNAAQKVCTDNGGTLAIAKTQAANDVLAAEITALGAGDNFWIGLNDKDKENTFMWEDGTAFDIYGFDNFAPKNGPRGGVLQHKIEDCVGMDKAGKWHDYRCNLLLLNKVLNYVCEF